MYSVLLTIINTQTIENTLLFITFEVTDDCTY